MVLRVCRRWKSETVFVRSTTKSFNEYSSVLRPIDGDYFVRNITKCEGIRKRPNPSAQKSGPICRYALRRTPDTCRVRIEVELLRAGRRRKPSRFLQPSPPPRNSISVFPGFFFCQSADSPDIKQRRNHRYDQRNDPYNECNQNYGRQNIVYSHIYRNTCRLHRTHPPLALTLTIANIP